MNKELREYVDGKSYYTPIMNIMMNNRTKDWYAELGRYIDSKINIAEYDDFSYFVKHRPKKNLITKIVDFRDIDNRFYFSISSTFLTSILDEQSLLKMFGKPILHDEFGEGFDGEWNEENDDYDEPSIKESYASYFVNISGTDFHIGYDHRGTRVEFKLESEYKGNPSDDVAEELLNSLKNLFDLYVKKIK
jgi:hypothetical protein